MSAGVSRAIMSLAACCLGETRREWAVAMEAEFETAVEAGTHFAFATGCLLATWREMPRQPEGRLVLTNYAVALGLLIPVAVMQFAYGAMSLGPGSPLGMTGARTNPFLLWSQISALPVLLLLWLGLGAMHLRLAWVLVERDWPSVIRSMAMICASTITLFLFTGVLFLDLAPLLSQAATLAVEIAALVGAARWHTRLFSEDSSEIPVW